MSTALIGRCGLGHAWSWTRLLGHRCITKVVKYQIIGAPAPAPITSKLALKKDPVLSAIRRLDSAGYVSFLDDAIRYWQEQKSYNGKMAAVPAHLFQAWKGQVTLGFDKFLHDRDDDLDQLDSEAMTSALDKIMIEQLLCLSADVVSFLCPTMPEIGFQHTIDGRQLQLVDRALTLHKSSGLAVAMIWKCADDKDSYAKTDAILSKDDVVWPGSLDDLRQFLMKNKLVSEFTNPV